MNFSEPREEIKTLTFPEFMNIMTDNLSKYRILNGDNNILFEADTNSAMCLICPYKVTNRKMLKKNT